VRTGGRVGEEEDGGAGFAVAREVIEVRLLEEEGDFGGVLFAGVAIEDERGVEGGAEFGSSRLVFGVGLSEAGRKGGGRYQEEENGEGGAAKDGWMPPESVSIRSCSFVGSKEVKSISNRRCDD